MPAKCDICGAAELENEHFVSKTMVFRGAKLYCPACRQSLYRRVSAVVALAILTMGIIGVMYALVTRTSPFASVPVQLAWLIALRWLMILPHELGHALAARLLGYKQIRILVGFGKPLFSMRFFGIPTLFNRIPFGGVTLSQPTGHFARRRLLVFVSAGLLVNLTAAVFGFYLASPGEIFNFHTGSAAKIFFWANSIVLMENILPHQGQTPVGILNSDGLQIFNILFRWNEPSKDGTTKIPSWEIVVRLLLKWTLFLIVLCAALMFLLLAALPFLPRSGENTWGLKILILTIMLPLAALAIYMSVRIAKDPIPRVRTKHNTAGSWPPSVLTPKLNILVQNAVNLGRQNDFLRHKRFWIRFSQVLRISLRKVTCLFAC